MEVKLTVEGEEEMDGTEQGHVQRDEYMRSSVSAPLTKWRILVCVGVILTVFCVGECFCCLFSSLPYPNVIKYHSVIIKE